MSMSIDEVRADMAAKFGPPRSGPPAQATLADVGVGWSVRERSPDGTWYDTRGGIVLDVDRRGAPDDEGEFHDRFTVVTSRRGQLVWANLRADQLTPVDDRCRPNAVYIRSVVDTAGQEAVKVGSLARKLELFSLACRLLAVVVHPLSVPAP